MSLNARQITDVVCDEKYELIVNKMDFRRFVTYRSVRIHIVVRLTGIDFTEEESSLRATLLCINVSWRWKSSGQYFRGVIDRGGEKLTEVFVLR